MDHNKQVLVVDDSRVSRLMSHKFILSKHADWQVIEAATGEEALEKMKAIAPVMILLDVNMPGMGGVAAAEQLRALYPETHIILVTANVQNAIRNRASEMNVGFMEKPVTETRIHQLIDSLGL